MKDIVVLAPIQDVYDKTVEIIREQNYSNVDVVLGAMSEGLEIAKRLEKEGVKIIVTRGGTYQLLKAGINIPVTEIKVTAYDIIESFGKLQDPDEVIGLVGYTNVVYGFDLLKKFIPNRVIMIKMECEEDIGDIVKEYQSKGIKTYIGDSNVARIVKELDCKGILINSQKESIMAAIQDARRIYRAIKEEKFRARRIAAVTDFVRDGIIVINQDEEITLFNKTAEKILCITADKAMNQKIGQVIPRTLLADTMMTGEIKIGEIFNLNGTKISANIIPITVNEEITGAVLTFQEISEILEMEYKIRKNLAQKGFQAKYHFSDIVHKSVVIDKCIDIAREYAKYDTPIHICGESGSGKELFCQSIHNDSSRKNGPFIAVNCAAIPQNLLESEFFGYEEGAFTGAKKGGKPGVFELAHNGTLFLDEISEIPMEQQGRLLRVLQEKEVMRVGGKKLIPVDVKIITASNKYLKQMVEEGLFRKDLYFRIDILTLRVPGLAKRKEDIPLLAQYFIRKYSGKYGKNPLTLSLEVETLLKNRKYEGNIRELENIIERCVVLSSFGMLYEEHDKEARNRLKEEGARKEPATNQVMAEVLSLKELEKIYIGKVFEENKQNVTKTCEILKINRSTLWRKLKMESGNKI